MLASLGTIELSLKPLEPSQHYRVERFKGLSSIGRTFLPRDAVSFGSFLQPGLLAAEGFQIQINRPFMPTIPTFAVRETDVSRTPNVGTVGKNGLTAHQKRLRSDCAPSKLCNYHLVYFTKYEELFCSRIYLFSLFLFCGHNSFHI